MATAESAAALSAVGALPEGSAMGSSRSNDAVVVWPQADLFRLLSLLQAESAVSLLLASTALRRQLETAVGTMRDAAWRPDAYLPRLEAQQVLLSLELAAAEAAQVTGGRQGGPPAAWQSASQ